MRQQLRNTAAQFAHLLGGRPAAASPAATNDKQREDESDEEFQKRRDRDSAESEPVQGDDESDAEFEKRKKKWQDENGGDDDDGDPSAEAEPPAAAAPAPRAEDETGDDVTDATDMRRQTVSAARLRERSRCAAIFRDEAAGKNPALAAELAFSTDLPRGQAIKVLRAGGLAVASPRNTLDRRMANVPVPPVVAGEPASKGPNGKPKAYQDATQVIVAGMKRRGESEASIHDFMQRRNG